MRGELLWFNEIKNVGAIRSDEGERLHVHGSGFTPGQVPVGRCAGTKVSFEREAAGVDRAPRAVTVSVVAEEPARRARRHHHSGR